MVKNIMTAAIHENSETISLRFARRYAGTQKDQIEMDEIGYSPGKEFGTSWWTDTIKPLVDFKGYLAQRRRILSNPNIILTPPVNDRNWRSPLGFAIQGLALPTLLASVTISIFFIFVKEPEPPWKDAQKNYEANLTQLHETEKQIKAAAQDQNFTFNDDDVTRSRDDALNECERRIARLEGRRWLIAAEPYVDKAQSILNKFVGPTALILAAYFFQRFLGTGQGRDGSNISRAKEVYLYFITSYIFWIAQCYNILLILLILSFRTGSDYIALFYGVLSVLGIAALIAQNNASKKLQGIFNLPLLEGKLKRKSGHNKIFSALWYSGFCALVTTVILLFVASWCWGTIWSFIDGLKA